MFCTTSPAINWMICYMLTLATLLVLHHQLTIKTQIMKIMKTFGMLVTVILFTATISHGQKTDSLYSLTKTTKVMKTYVIEREVPGAGKMTPEQLKGLSQASCGVLKQMGSDIEWVQSYVTGNKLYCVYRAENEELIKEHARKGGFPCNSVAEVKNVIGPRTAE
jgi:hypothetical protein